MFVTVIDAADPQNGRYALANPFGGSPSTVDSGGSRMDSVDAIVERTAAPADAPQDFLDARELPPPKPLQETLERIETHDDETVFVQLNDRTPQLLYPKLEDRGYAYETLEVDEGMVTIIWTTA